MMSPAQFKKERINDALKHTNGDRHKAAELIGCTYEDLVDDIERISELRNKWTERKDPPTPIETLSRDLRIPDEEKDISQEDRDVIEQYEAEDVKIRLKLAKMGLNERQLEIALACRESGHEFERGSLQIIAGGATRMAIMHQAQAVEVENRLAKVRTKLTLDKANCGADREKWVAEELGLMRVHVMLGDSVRKMMEMRLKAALVQSVVDKKSTVSGAALPHKRAKPGYVVDVGDQPPRS